MKVFAYSCDGQFVVTVIPSGSCVTVRVENSTTDVNFLFDDLAGAQEMFNGLSQALGKAPVDMARSREAADRETATDKRGMLVMVGDTVKHTEPCDKEMSGRTFKVVQCKNGMIRLDESGDLFWPACNFLYVFPF